MNTEIGFVLLTHNNPLQALRLIDTLNKMFSYPPIVIHHDFSKEAFPTHLVTKNVSFVEQYVETSWGRFSLVEAKILALKVLYSRVDSPHWYAFISGADYPVKSADKILQDLNQSPYDLYLRSKEIKYGNFDKPWKKAYYKRYCGLNIVVDMKNKTGRKVVRQLNLLYHPFFTRLLTPFNKEFRCYAGEQWYTGNRQAANYLLDCYDNMQAVVDHYKKVKIPDESFYQTMFCNNPSLKISPDNLRYVDWSQGLPNPKSLVENDWGAIQASSAHFARKIDYVEDDPLISLIDREIM